MEKIIKNNYIYKALFLVLAVLLFLSLLSYPLLGNLANHDNGSVAAYDYWTHNGFLYGKEIAQNVGPLGFINSINNYTGFFQEIKLSINILLMFLLTSLLVLNLKKTSVSISFFVMIISILYLNSDSKYYILISLIFIYLLNGNLSIIKYLLITVLALMSLSKAMFFFLSCIIIIIIFLINLSNKQYKKSIIVTLIYMISFSIFWKLSKQNLSNLPEFINGIFIFSIGYNEAMSIFESKPIFIAGLSSFILAMLNFLFLFLLSINLKTENTKVILFSFFLFFEGALFFVAWKHGFVRADQHVNTFFTFLMLNNFLIMGFAEVLFMENNSTLKQKLFKFTKVNIIIISIISLVSISIVNRLSPVEILNQKVRQIKSSLFFYFNPIKSYKNLKLNLNNEIKLVSLSDVRNIVGNSSISYFGMSPGYAIQNNFNYITSPATISFASFNDIIMNKEAQFYSDEMKLPEYILYDLETIDDRLIAQDNSLAKLEILKRYGILGFEKGITLLKKNNQSIKFKKNIISSNNVNINKWVSVPEYKKNVVWLNVENKNQNYLSKILSFFYKPPKYMINIKFTDGTIRTFKLILNMAKSGFMITPMIFNNLDYYYFNKYIENKNKYQKYQKKISNIMISCKKLIMACSKNLKITFSNINFDKKKSDFSTMNSSHWKLPVITDHKTYKNYEFEQSPLILEKDMLFNKNKDTTKLNLEYSLTINNNSKKSAIEYIVNKIKDIISYKVVNIDLKKGNLLPNFFIDFIDMEGKKSILYKETLLLKNFNNKKIKKIKIELPKQKGMISISTNYLFKSKKINLIIKSLKTNSQ